jgi:putative RecB family exonuclease
VFGSAFHETLENYLTTHTYRLVTLWQDTWTEQLERNIEYGIDWGHDSEEGMAALGVKMFSDPDTIALVDSLQPLVSEEQVQIERYVELQVPGVPIPVIGYIDLIEQDGVPVDFKTSARSWSQKQADSEMQPVFYLAALNQAGHDLSFGIFRHYVFVKSKQPKVQIWESTRTIKDLFWLFGLISDVWRGIECEVFPPNPGTWKCNPKYCEYWGMCRGAK